MSVVSLGPGDDVDAWCTRCRMNLNHRIIAMVGNTIKTVLCLTCESTHKYHPPKQEKPVDEDEYEDVEIKSASQPKVTDRAAAKMANEWATFMKSIPEDAEPKPYSPAGSYALDDYIQHPVFGKGKVIEIIGQGKMLVVFQEGRKILIYNRPASPAVS